MTDPLDKTSADVPPDGSDRKDSAAHSGPIKAVPVRHYGRWISAVVVLGLLALLVRAFADAQIQWSVVGEQITNGTFAWGAWETLKITVYSMVIGVVLGAILAVMRLSPNPVLSSVAWGYIWFFRGTPVLVQILLWFNLSLVFQYLDLGFIYKDEMNQVMTPFVAALLALGLNEAAYMAEICRAGIQSVDSGQTEAAHALGMKGGKTMRRIVLPQAMRVIIPPTGNEFINMLKTSSLAFAIGYGELFLRGREFGSRTLAIMEGYIVISLWYLLLTTVFSIGQYYLERYYARGSSRSLPPTPMQRLRKQLSSFRVQSNVGGVKV
ncbi:amino acid ABC transporter permease [Streptomyces sp. NPDC003023]|uniref:amino acid ABC transporter permease n=1 Tax=Streptomyces sp. NPDC003023 TaxID=3364675 RepID=UPI0036A3A460